MAVYDAVADDDTMGGMWDMMDGMDGMHGMMNRGTGPQTTGSASGSGQVRIVDFRFEPSLLTVTPGTIVTWTNEDSAPHTATAEDESFDTGRLDKGESGEVTFDTSGTFDYICVYHPYMEGSVLVTDASPR
jgi:plastocyanin